MTGFITAEDPASDRGVGFCACAWLDAAARERTTKADTNRLVILVWYREHNLRRTGNRASVQGPQRQRRGVLDEHSIARDSRLSPGGAVRESVPLQRFESIPAAPRHDQLSVVVQEHENSAGL